MPYTMAITKAMICLFYSFSSLKSGQQLIVMFSSSNLFKIGLNAELKVFQINQYSSALIGVKMNIYIHFVKCYRIGHVMRL